MYKTPQDNNALSWGALFLRPLLGAHFYLRLALLNTREGAPPPPLYARCISQRMKLSRSARSLYVRTVDGNLLALPPTNLTKKAPFLPGAKKGAEDWPYVHTNHCHLRLRIDAPEK